MNLMASQAVARIKICSTKKEIPLHMILQQSIYEFGQTLF